MSWNFSDVIELLRLDLVSALLIAVLLGGGVGLQRELRGKSAGLRTNILICVGAALFTQMSQSMALLAGDPTRIAAQIVTGVGFLGAGAILHSKGHVTGLTSAATIWLVAAIGMAVGAGAIYEAAGAALLSMKLRSCLLGMTLRAISRVCSGVRRCFVSGCSFPAIRALKTSPALM